MKSKPVVAGIGELLWDVLPSGKQLGGAPCNFAFQAMQAGCESFAVSAVGRDALGSDLKNNINDLGLSDKYIQENEYPTSKVTVRLDEKGSPDFTIHENVAWDHIKLNDNMKELAAKADAICFGSLAQRDDESQHSIRSFISATKPGCLRVFDINLRQKFYSEKLIINSLDLSDVLKLNDDELPVVAHFLGFTGTPEEQIEMILERFNLKFIVFTLGSRGSIIKSANESSFSQAPEVIVADAVGAGDAFTAVFIAGILKGIPLKETHQKATEIAAYVCTQKGATPKYPKNIF